MSSKYEQSLLLKRRRNLPHLEKEHATYFVTFRLADSLPESATLAYLAKKRDMELAIERAATDHAQRQLRIQLATEFARDIDSKLDRSQGQCFLNDPQVAACVSSSISHFDGDRYNLRAWCIMPNHVHVLVGVKEAGHLASILHSWKSFSAKIANHLLSREGTFWQREYFDHLVRSEGGVLKYARYIFENPVKAGLECWPHVWLSDDLKGRSEIHGNGLGGLVA
jgi:REP element-mobilizing transposase RayT